MSFQNQSGDLASFVEVVPESAKMGQVSKSSLLTQRKRCRLTPQTGPTAGPSQQVQFLLADGNGLVDLRSVVVNYTMSVSTAAGGNLCPDDGHPFMTAQALLNGQLLENIQNAPKYFNVEATMGGSKTYYQTAGSFQAMELLNDDLVADALTTTALSNTTTPQYGSVINNVASISARYKRSANFMWNNTAGSQRSVPLGLILAMGKCPTLLPLALCGELGLIFQTGSVGDVLFQPTASTDGTYTLSNISLEYDIVVPDQRYMALLQKVASEEAGITIPYESVVISTGTQFGTGGVPATSLQETSIITSRATNHLTKSAIVFVPTALTSSINYPSQSCFSHAGLFGFQTRIGSSVFPQIAAQGDASIFATSLTAYGSAVQENGSATNRVLWAQSTNGSSAGTPQSYEDAVSTSGSIRFAYADRCIPSYGYRVVKGGAEPLDVDGVSLAGASGSQIIHTIISAPQTGYTPYVLLSALRFIKASGGAVSVVGA
jgi:hypothetical protein